MSDTLYIKLEQNIRVPAPSVTIGQLGSLWCADDSVTAGCSALHFTTIHGKRAVSDILEVTRVIQQEYPAVTVENLGETDFILEYIDKKPKPVAWEWVKAGLVCLIIFFGAAFSIMTFNADVSVEKVFSDLHLMLTGETRDGLTWLEIGYTSGLFLGIVIFYNHFRKRARFNDPTPLEVEMRNYEREINQTILDEQTRMKQRQKRLDGTPSGGHG